MNIHVWLGIAFCISQYAIFSGLNLGVFSVSRMRLETSAHAGEKDAIRVLALRHDANMTLATILWGNVAVGVLLTLLADSILTGTGAFIFSTLVISLLGEILPQAYFARNALRMAALLSPVLRFYQFVLWPVARPTALFLDAWVGREAIPWYRERELGDLLRHHARTGGTELSILEITGAINFLALDDLPVGEEGETLDPRSVIAGAVANGRPHFPEFSRALEDPFLRRVDASGMKWVVLIDDASEPRFVVNAHGFLRAALLGGTDFDPVAWCHRPLVVRDPALPLGRVLGQLIVRPEHGEDDVIDEDLILLWTEDQRRIITGTDLFGRLLRGIARHESKRMG
jgi:metal transporter CNNM